MELNESEFIDMPIGYIFTNGDVEYRVTNSGVLIVTNKKQGKLLLEEKGKWN